MAMSSIKNRVEQTNMLVKAVKFNHDYGSSMKCIVNPEKELEAYDQRITQLTLPNRFGMYREQVRNVPTTTPTKVEQPADKDISELDSSSSSILANEGHKLRGIFD